MKMKNLSLLFFLFIGGLTPIYSQVQINVDGGNVSHTIHPMIQGQGLVYSEEADSIYNDGSMAQLYQDVGAGFLRWPGGTVATMYHWNDLTGVGWVDKWNPSYNTASDKDPSVYMDLDEYMTLTNAIGSEPVLGINMSSGIEWDREAEALQEAMDMIQYCLDNNFNVKYFYLDNETYHDGNGYNKDADGDGGEWTPTTYAEQINIYATAIKSLVPDAKLIANWTDKIRTNIGGWTILINDAGDNIDYIDVHWYWKWGVANWTAWKAVTPMQNDTEWYDGGTFVEEINFFNNLAASLGKPHIKLAALEWNIAPGDYNVNPAHTQFMQALMQSEMQMQFMQGGLELASMWTTQWSGSSTAEFQQLVNSDDNYAPSPSAKIFELYKNAINGKVVSSTSSDGQIMATTIIKGDKAYVYLLSKADVTKNTEFTITGYDVLSVDQAIQFKDPGELMNIGLWTGGSGNFQANIDANTLTMVAFNVEKTYTPVAVTGVAISAQSGTLSPTDTEQLTATISPVDATNQSVTWSSDDLAVATVNPSGLVTAVSVGSANITVTSVDGTFTASTAITVSPVAVTGVNLVVNGDFEDGLNNWTLWNNPTITTTDVYEGISALQMFDKGSIYQWVSVSPSTTYTLSVYAKTSDATKNVVLGIADGNETNIATQDIYDTEYTLHQLTVTTDAITTSIKVWAWQPPSVTASAYIDDIKLIEGAATVAVTGVAISTQSGTLYPIRHARCRSVLPQDLSSLSL